VNKCKETEDNICKKKKENCEKLIEKQEEK